MRRSQRVCQTRGVVPRDGSRRGKRGLHQRGVDGVAWAIFYRKYGGPVKEKTPDLFSCSFSCYYGFDHGQVQPGTRSAPIRCCVPPNVRLPRRSISTGRP